MTARATGTVGRDQRAAVAGEECHEEQLSFHHEPEMKLYAKTRESDQHVAPEPVVLKVKDELRIIEGVRQGSETEGRKLNTRGLPTQFRFVG